MQLDFILSSLWTQTSSLKFDEFIRLKSLGLSTVADIVAATNDDKLRSFLLDKPDWIEQSKISIDWILKRGGRITFPGQEDYPPGLLDLEDPPLFLSYLGKPVWQSSKMLSVVGSREATKTSLTWMELELPALANRGICLCSGGARGIDQRAHAISLRSGKPTIAFLPSGLGAPYPESFSDWIHPIIEAGGAVVSELAPSESMMKHYFLKRNRMIATISAVTLVVEARRQSGTMITAREAAANSRTLAVVPGHPSDPKWTGNLDLILNGAVMVRDQWDLVLLLDSSGKPGEFSRLQNS
jgi:DNA processing protein